MTTAMACDAAKIQEMWRAVGEVYLRPIAPIQRTRRILCSRRCRPGRDSGLSSTPAASVAIAGKTLPRRDREPDVSELRDLAGGDLRSGPISEQAVHDRPGPA